MSGANNTTKLEVEEVATAINIKFESANIIEEETLLTPN